MIMEFGKGDIIFGTAHTKEDKSDEPYMIFWKSDKEYPINKPLPELENSVIDNWSLRMNFSDPSGIDSLIAVLQEHKEHKFPAPTKG